ncbi:unnamed protein product [Calypogeia fissa]
MNFAQYTQWVARQLSFKNLNGSIPDLTQSRAFATDDQLLLDFQTQLFPGLQLQPEQVFVQSYEWQPGPRLLMIILIDTPANAKFNMTEVNRIETLLSNWGPSNSALFEPYELLAFVFLGEVSKKLSVGAMIGIVIGSIALVLVAILLVAFFILRKKGKAVNPEDEHYYCKFCSNFALNIMIPLIK